MLKAKIVELTQPIEIHVDDDIQIQIWKEDDAIYYMTRRQLNKDVKDRLFIVWSGWSQRRLLELK